MAWLGPMVRDTAQWQVEQNMDRTRWFDGSPQVYALPTLTMRWADKEKVQAVTVEVLVVLSCICWHEKRRRGSDRLSRIVQRCYRGGCCLGVSFFYSSHYRTRPLW